jgi:pyridoxal phosphate enzyme (YggS family)
VEFLFAGKGDQLILSRDDIARNLEDVNRRIERAAKRSGRKVSDVRVLAVTKTQTLETVREAIAAGLRLFGENYVQEAEAKIAALPGHEAEFHFIGHLQANKVRKALKLFSVIQSVDSLELARRIDALAREMGKPADVLVQVNPAEEGTKHGLDPGNLLPFIEQASHLEGLRIVGLMAIPPPAAEPEDNRPHFKLMARLADEINERRFPMWEYRYLSMGMSDDFEAAVEEGANLVRIGTALFGPRR